MNSTAPAVPVLIVDADPAYRRVLAQQVSGGGAGRFRPVAFGSMAEASAADASGIVIADVETLGGLPELTSLGRSRPLIAMSARGSVASAVEAMKAGAIDFLPKPFGAKLLLERLEAAIAGLGKTPAKPANVLPVATSDFEGFVGRSASMRGVYDIIDRIAASRAPVFITGESGTGKEVCAEAIHARSGDAERPFVAINCGAIPRELVESEIFGHIRGAFTGATDDRTGAAELADGGTLFLDEIGEMPLALQPKLLRFVQTGLIQRVGESRTRKVDIRLICATNRDAQGEVAAGRFREDLLYRLNVLPVRLPPLRERQEDIPVLASYFLTRYAAEEGAGEMSLDPSAQAFLAGHAWPGNVRQLQNLMRRVVVLHRGPNVTVEALTEAEDGPARLVEGSENPAPRGQAMTYHDQERRMIEAAIAANGGNISRAAAALGINPSTIHRKRQKWKAPD